MSYECLVRQSWILELQNTLVDGIDLVNALEPSLYCIVLCLTDGVMHCTSLLMQSSSCARKEIKAHVLTLDITSMSIRSQIDIFHPCVHTNTKKDDDKTSLVQQDVMLIMSVHIKRLSAGSCISSHERHVSYVRQLCASVAYSFSKHHPSFYKLRLIE